MKNNIKKFAALAVTFIVTFVSLSPLALAGTLTSTSVSGVSLVAGATTSYTVNFTTETFLPGRDYFLITFPAGYDVTGATVDPNSACSPMLGDYTIPLNGIDGAARTILMKRDTWPSGRYLSDLETAGGSAESCTWNNIVNPTTTGITGNFAFETRGQWNESLLDSASISGVTITSGAQNVPEFSTYMYLLTIIAGGWMLKNKFHKQEQEI